MVKKNTLIKNSNSNNLVYLSTKNITKKYPGTIALNNVDFNVYKGKVNALVGENGAGKSTLMKILAGIEQPDKGVININNKNIKLNNIKEAELNGIGIIHQELNLFPNLNVYQNIFMARESKNFKVLLNNKVHKQKAKEILEKLEHPLDINSMLSELKVGQQQIVEIARTMVQQDLKILIMDEPTSSLSAAEVEVLFKIISELKEQGISIIYISHRLEEIVRIGDYVTILRDGCLIAEEKVKNIDIAWIVKKMVGCKNNGILKRENLKNNEIYLKVNCLNLPQKGGGFLLEDVSFNLRKGEILGVYGLLGAGRTELIETLIGMHPEATGDIYLDGEKINSGSIWGRMRKGFAHIPEDRQREGLVQTLSVSKNISLASLSNYTKFFHLCSKKEEKSVLKIIKDLFIKVADPKLPILSLSGGNQQKVVIGKGILTLPKILLLDEPSRGIDVNAKSDVFKIIYNLSRKGLGIIVVASELKEIISISDRVIVLSNGKLTGEFEGKEIKEQALVDASSVGHGIGNFKK